MCWIISFFISVAVLVLTIAFSAVLAKVKYNRKRVLTTFNVVFSGVFVSSVVLFFPLYLKVFDFGASRYLKTFLLSVHNTLRLFIVDGEFSFVTEHITAEMGWIYTPYTVLMAVLFVVSPFLTFGVVMSFFKNISAYKRYMQSYFADVFVFSELNEKSLALAKDLKKNSPKRAVVFTDVFESSDELSYELSQKAYEIGAILFKNDVCVVNFTFHSCKKSLSFFAIGNDCSENIEQALELIGRYNSRENTSLYVFSTSADSELLLNSVDKGKIKVRRINEVQSLINRSLYDDGYRIFESAKKCGDVKKISACVIGMGLHGTEMTKALAWFCQMDGYSVEINSFDKDPRMESRFSFRCPELMDPKYNTGVYSDGDASYKINVRSGVDVYSGEFLEILTALENVTYIFIALGNDEDNLNMAVALRSFMTKCGHSPVIDAVVCDSYKTKALVGITNYSGQEYDINFIGDLETSYSESVVLDSDVEAVALERHLKWGEEEQFWKYEYNYRSSVASAIHRKMKTLCGIPGVDKDPKDRSEDELWALRRLEHRRWNAYMRSEGYVYAKERNNMAKTHHCLVPFDELSEKDKIKDDD